MLLDGHEDQSGAGTHEWEHQGHLGLQKRLGFLDTIESTEILFATFWDVLMHWHLRSGGLAKNLLIFRVKLLFYQRLPQINPLFSEVRM